MFWEMDKGNHENTLKEINEYLLSFFQFAAQSASTEFQESEWIAFAGIPGKWLYLVYKRDAKNGKEMHSAIDQLFLLERRERKKIYKAVVHDHTFSQEHTSEFKLESTALKPEYQKILKGFYLYFYNVSLYSSQFEVRGKKFGRKELAEKFFEGKNAPLRTVCPVCLQSMTNAEKEDEIEHYFGKAFVPCLALHPDNLYFCCPTCNKIYKGIRSPFYRKSQDIRKIFLPYLDVIREQVKIEFTHHENQDGVKLVPENRKKAYIEEKIEAVENIFQLEERWSGMLEVYFSALTAEYEAFGATDIDNLKKEMERDLKKAKAKVKVCPNLYIETEYLEWLYQKQLKAFYSNMKQKDDKPVIVQ